MKKIGDFLFKNSKAIQGGLSQASKPLPQTPKPHDPHTCTDPTHNHGATHKPNHPFIKSVA